MLKILLDENGTPDANKPAEVKKEKKPEQNIFQGRTEAVAGNAKFPAWDIVPPSQFINPRIKHQ